MSKKALLIAALTLGTLTVSAIVILLQTTFPSVANVEPESMDVAAAETIEQVNAGWTSDWIVVEPNSIVTLSHDLGGDPSDYVVEPLYRDLDSLGFNSRAYGGMETDGGHYYGIAWQQLTSNTIEIFRQADDIYADQVRVRVFEPAQTASYCSPWTPISRSQTITLEHNVGGDVDELVVGLVFSSTQVGINQHGYGGLEAASEYHGAFWHNLTTTSVAVTRHADDAFADQIRVCVNAPDTGADYDSGWLNLEADQILTITHDLHWSPMMYRMRLDYQDTDSDYGIHHYAAGGMAISETLVGVNWQMLTPNTLQVWRAPNDERADQVRARIWTLKWNVYLPFVLRNHTPPVELAHDDGEVNSYQSWNIIGNGFATCSSPPGGSARLQTARYYLQQPATIEVHVWDASSHADLLTPFQATPTQDGWNDIDLSSYNLTVNSDFCVGFAYTLDSRPSLGVDTDNSGHSYEVDGDYWELGTSEYMIRVIVQ